MLSPGLKEVKVWLAHQTKIPAVQTVGKERQPLLASMSAKLWEHLQPPCGNPELGLYKGGTPGKRSLGPHHRKDWGEEGPPGFFGIHRCGISMNCESLVCFTSHLSGAAAWSLPQP